jgi:8-oxo-dGTP diphosphatase
MSVYLVRHAKAGQRHYGMQDRERGLTADGYAQASALPGHLVGVPVRRLLSSPFVRCVQTLEPLAAAAGCDIEQTMLLAEAMPFGPVIDLMESLPDGSVLCSHGDLIPETIDALVRRGLDIIGEPRWNKGSVWVLDRDEDGWIAGRSFTL